MRRNKVNNTKVGLLVLSGVLFLVFTLYMVGKNRNLFGTTVTVKAVLTNVNGLVPGNNVRFKGIDVGTVRSIHVENDTAIYVVMTIDKKMKQHIKRNAIASIGTDGLMGNKLININSGDGSAPPIETNDILQSRKPIETDEMLRTLNTTNNNIERISQNLYEISVKLNSSESLWSLLSDTVITRDLKRAVVDFKQTAENTSALTATARNVVNNFEEGKGIANTLFSDTTLSIRLSASLEQIQHASNETAAMMKELKLVVDGIKQGEGTAGLILSDSSLRQSLMNSAANVEQGTDRFNQNMEALKSHFLFRGYFKKQEKLEKKEAEGKTD